MVEAFYEMTGRPPKMEKSKNSLYAENKQKGKETLEKEYQEKMQNWAFTPKFREKYSLYVGSIEEWRKIKGFSLATKISLNPNPNQWP